MDRLRDAPPTSAGAAKKKWVRWIAVWLGSAVLVVLAIGGALIWATQHQFYPKVPAPHFPPPQSIEEAQRQDLQYFRHYLEYDRAYTPAARAQASRLLEDYHSRAGRLTPAEFELGVTRMAALADNGHSRVYPSGFRRRHNSLPCRLYHFSDGYYIVRARLACQALLGARLLGIDGYSTAQIVDRMFQYSLWARNHYDQYIAPFYLESPELLHAAGLAAAADHVTLHALLQDGTQRDMTLTADPPDPQSDESISSDFYLAGEPVPSAGSGWKALLPAATQSPLFISDRSNPFHAMKWGDAYYVAFRSNQSAAGHPIAPFVADVRQQIARHNPRIVILDLRLDQGGDLTTTADLMSHITTLAPAIERVYVLTSAWTFSAGITSAALAREHGGAKVTIVGQGVGDRLRFWGEGRDLTLPNSGIILHFATGLHDYTRSCLGEPGCYWIMRLFPMQVRTLAPDVTVPYTFADYCALRDP
ncbi:MAG TPA: hypothetical protein VF764_10750, partial [Steroidobacteraceae bacterium]